MKIQKLRSFVGLEIASIKLLVHDLDNHVDFEHPIEIQFTVDNLMFFTIKCASDGESIQIISEISDEVFMGEMGNFRLVEIPSGCYLGNFVGNQIAEIQLINSKISNSIIGLALVTKTATYNILNLGDELNIVSKIPPDINLTEELIFTKLD